MLCRNYVLPEDLDYFLPAEKAAKAFELLDVDSDGRVTLHDIRDAVLNVYKVRWLSLSVSLSVGTPLFQMAPLCPWHCIIACSMAAGSNWLVMHLMI